MNLRLIIEYDGESFYGWQRQPDLPTIQEAIESVIQRVVGVRIPVRGAGRTDSGVHALAQVANFHVPSEKIEAKRWQAIFNTHLPSTIRVLDVAKVEDTFDAQRNAISKIYRYQVLNRAYASALNRRVLFLPRKVDWGLVQQGLSFFLGEHDFKSFQGAGSSVKTTVRKIFRFELSQMPGQTGLYQFEVEGSGFLKQMVRAMVGTLLEVGTGVRTIESLSNIFEARDRREAGRNVPARGLCLVSVQY